MTLIAPSHDKGTNRKEIATTTTGRSTSTGTLPENQDITSGLSMPQGEVNARS